MTSISIWMLLFWVQAQRLAGATASLGEGEEAFVLPIRPRTAPQHTILLTGIDQDTRSELRSLCAGERFEIVGEAANDLESAYMAYRHQPRFVILPADPGARESEESSHVARLVAPGTVVIALSSATPMKPTWADAQIDKLHIRQIIPLLQSLQPPREDGTETSGSRRTTLSCVLPSLNAGLAVRNAAELPNRRRGPHPLHLPHRHPFRNR